MDNLSEQFSEVLVNPEHFSAAMALGPLVAKDMLGKKSMIFENVEAAVLEKLGELHVPSIADLFVAKMQRGEA